MGDLGKIDFEKEVRVIETKFKNKKANKVVKQYLVKFPKKMVDRFNINKDSKILFDIKFSESGEPQLHMELKNGQEEIKN